MRSGAEGWSSARLTLYWIPLGAGGSPVVRLSGRVYEALAARREHRRAEPLVHAALRVELDGTAHVVEVAPAWDSRSVDRGVVSGGAVGSRVLGWSPWFRYEVRSWRDGRIPDEGYAVETVVLDSDPMRAAALLAAMPAVPTPVWGRDELGTGDMWNSNSVVAWLLSVSDHRSAGPPVGCRAPGWRAGEVTARPRSAVPLKSSRRARTSPRARRVADLDR